MEVLHHPNIVHFREVYTTKNGKLCIVMDYASGGDLLQLIKKKHKDRKAKEGALLEYWSENTVLNWFT